MKSSKFNKIQVSKILKEFDQRKDVETITREHEVSKAIFAFVKPIVLVNFFTETICLPSSFGRPTACSSL